MLLWPSPSGCTALWGENAACRGWKRGGVVCFCFRDGLVTKQVCRALSESGSSSARRVRWSRKVAVCVCVSGVWRSLVLCLTEPLRTGRQRTLGCMCVCVILSLSMCSGTRADRQASWWACALRRRDLSLRVCVCVHAPPFPADVAAFLAKARPCSAGAVTSRVRTCVCVCSRGGVCSRSEGGRVRVRVCSPSLLYVSPVSECQCVGLVVAHASFFAEDVPSTSLSLVAVRGSLQSTDRPEGREGRGCTWSGIFRAVVPVAWRRA